MSPLLVRTANGAGERRAHLKIRPSDDNGSGETAGPDGMLQQTALEPPSAPPDGSDNDRARKEARPS